MTPPLRFSTAARDRISHAVAHMSYTEYARLLLSGLCGRVAAVLMPPRMGAAFEEMEVVHRSELLADIEAEEPEP